MAASVVVKVRKDGKVTLTDGAALSYEITYEDGDFQASQPKRGSTIIRDRGVIAGERQTDVPEGTLSFSVHMREFKDGTAAALISVIEKEGAWSAAVSVGGAGYESFLHKVTMTVEGTDMGDSADHTAVFDKVKLEWDFAEGDPNKINVKGTVLGGVTRTGQA